MGNPPWLHDLPYDSLFAAEILPEKKKGPSRGGREPGLVQKIDQGRRKQQ